MVSILQVGAACLALLLASGQGPDEDAAGIALPEGQTTTRSIGHPYYGKLRDGVALAARGPHHELQRSTRLRKWNYGTAYLVRALLVTAREIAEQHPGGEPLVIGNLSRHGGGDIDLSMSHNTGRDVDIAYFTADLDGASVPSRYHAFGPDGRSKDAPSRYKLDLDRNWAFVRSWILSREAEAQWIIVAPFIERLMLDHARAKGEPEWLLERAARMMTLPGFAKLHDNHIHARVLCSVEDWRKGCRNGGPVWPWNSRMVEALDSVRREVAPLLASEEPAQRQAGLARLVERDVQTAVADVAALLSDSDGDVRKAALEALLELTTEANAATVLKIARWCEHDAAASLLAKALPLAGADALPAAQALVDGSHPVQSGSLKRRSLRRLERAAKRVVNAHAPSAPGG